MLTYPDRQGAMGEVQGSGMCECAETTDYVQESLPFAPRWWAQGSVSWNQSCGDHEADRLTSEQGRRRPGLMETYVQSVLRTEVGLSKLPRDGLHVSYET